MLLECLAHQIFGHSVRIGKLVLTLRAPAGWAVYNPQGKRLFPLGGPYVFALYCMILYYGMLSF